MISSSKAKILCQSKTHTYLGFELENDIIKIPLRTIRTIENMEPLCTLTECMKLIGYTIFHCQLLWHAHIYTHFLTKKLRKEAGPLVFNEYDLDQLQKLKDILKKVNVKGFLLAIDPSIRRRRYTLYTDWSNICHLSSGTLIVSVTNEHGTTSLPACCISKSLPDHLKSRGSTINELYSITVTILGCSAILYGIPFHVYTDNLALVFLMGKRFSAEVAAHNPIVQRLLLSVCSFSFIVSYCPGDLQVADYLSRIKTELGQPVDEFLSKTSKLEDYDKVADLLRPGRDKESEDAFINRCEKNIKLIRKLESEMGDTRRELYSYFRSTHYSLSDMMPTKLSQKPTTNHVDHSRQLPVTRDECKDSSFLDKLTTGEDEAAEWARVNELLSGIPFFKRRF